MNNLRTRSRRRSIRGLARILTAVAFGSFLIYVLASARSFAGPISEPVAPIGTEGIEVAAEPMADFSRFTHSNQFHSRLPCLICHRRDTNSPRIGFPGKVNHLPCAGCHAAQFNDPSSPICTICHTNSQTGAMKRFPPLRSFGARFNHAKHLRTSCTACHAPQGRGVAKSIPSGPSAHMTCFRCHTANASIAMSSCSTCHQPGRFISVPEWTRAFRLNFSHAKHASGRMSCATCHTVRAGSARGRQVSSPLASMHFAPANSLSCGGCHNGDRAFGPDDFANCKRCHTGNSFRF
jgi:c(7)-type cytochrome triheme protein